MKTTKRLMRNEEEIGKLMHVNKVEHDVGGSYTIIFE